MSGTNGAGVWVTVDEQMPDERHADREEMVVVREWRARPGFSDSQPGDDGGFWRVDTVHYLNAVSYDQWLDTTVAVVKQSDHEAALAKLQTRLVAAADFLDELRGCWAWKSNYDTGYVDPDYAALGELLTEIRGDQSSGS